MASLIQLSMLEAPASKLIYGGHTFTAAAGKHVKVETSPAGLDVMDEIVPRGKSWEVTVAVSIKETSA